MKIIKPFLISIIIASCGSDPSSNPSSYNLQSDTPLHKANLVVSIENLRNNDGNLCLNVFDGPEGFPQEEDRAMHSQCYELKEDSLSFEIPNLTVGQEYGIAVFHDENANNKLDTVPFIGIPKEGYGFSQNPGFKPGVPSFNEIKFKFDRSKPQEMIQLRYLL